MAPIAQPINKQRYIASDLFTYAVQYDSIAAQQSVPGSFLVDQDSDFEWLKATYFADLNAGDPQTADTRVIPLVTVQIVVSTSSRNLENLPVAVPSLFGTGEIPFILPQPKIFPARSNIVVNTFNFSSATEYRLRLYFIGRKLFLRS